MFFSSSSRLEGLLLSLMAKESFLHTFMAREPAGGRNKLIMLAHVCGSQGERQEDNGVNT